ncbi:MAG: glycosyltransferase family 2 protein [Dysgonomonas sp.]|nr:glycosyltransferase family 2 protein [Dysgonomonas sp.]
MNKKISIVLCSYNEALNLPTVVEAIHHYVDPLGYQLEIVIVNDGSSDNSSQVISEMRRKDPSIYYIEFSRNFGHQQALRAGIDHATGDCIISMDADMQHPPRLLPKFIEKWKEGYNVVYTRRQEDKSLPKFKRLTSSLFYKIINYLSDLKLEDGCADFRLIDRKVANVIKSVKEDELFVRGFVNWVGFKQYCMDYIPDKRLFGSTKYTFKKMLHMATQGILSFSTKPLRLALYVGFIISMISFVVFIPYGIGSFFFKHTISGWASLTSIVAFLGGFILFVLGLIGLYIGRIFNQIKGFPSYVVKNTNMNKTVVHHSREIHTHDTIKF